MGRLQAFQVHTCARAILVGHIEMENAWTLAAFNTHRICRPRPRQVYSVFLKPGPEDFRPFQNGRRRFLARRGDQSSCAPNLRLLLDRQTPCGGTGRAGQSATDALYSVLLGVDPERAWCRTTLRASEAASTTRSSAPHAASPSVAWSSPNMGARTTACRCLPSWLVACLVCQSTRSRSPQRASLGAWWQGYPNEHLEMRQGSRVIRKSKERI